MNEHPARFFLMKVAKACRRAREPEDRLKTTHKLIDTEGQEYIIDFKKFAEGDPDYMSCPQEQTEEHDDINDYYITEPEVELSEFYDKLMIFDIAS
jgi:hypothetical protein